MTDSPSELNDSDGEEFDSDSIPPELEGPIREICSAYLNAVNAGEHPDRRQWEERHPDLMPYLGWRLAWTETVATLAYGSDSQFETETDSATERLRDDGSETSRSEIARPDDSAHATRQPSNQTESRASVCPHCSSLNHTSQVDATRVVCAHCGDSYVVSGSATDALVAGVPRRVGRFFVLAILGRGTFGTVYRAYDPDFRQVRAIKVPRVDESSSSHELEERVLAEARSAARLRHLSFVQILEIGRDEQHPFLVMEYIDGTQLEARIAQEKFGVPEAISLVAELAKAMDYAHRCGVIHRDLKPTNILLDSHQRPIIIDYGLARHGDTEIIVNEQGDIIGSPAYMSPEQACGDLKRVCSASDVYSLGIILYRLLTGTLPFTGNSGATIQKVIHEQPTPPRQLAPHITASLEAIVLKAISKDIAARHQSALELAKELLAEL